MDWSNERYVRVFTRDTDDWLVMSWEARALLLMVLRKVDRAGVLETRRGTKGVAALVGMPSEVVTRALPELLDGEGAPLLSHERGYVVRNYIEAQEAAQSDPQRQREARARRRDRALLDVTRRDADVTNRDEAKCAVTNRDVSVTGGHGASQSVTPSEPADPAKLEPKAAHTRARDPSTADVAVDAAVDDVVVVLPPPAPSRDQRTVIRRTVWESYRAFHGRTKALLAAGGYPPPLDPFGPVADEMAHRLDELKAGGCDWADVQARLIHAVEVCAAKALRDQNMRHFVTCFDPGDFAYSVETTPDDIAASRPSALARGRAATRRDATAISRAAPLSVLAAQLDEIRAAEGGES